jgi:hypothetical protein
MAQILGCLECHAKLAAASDESAGSRPFDSHYGSYSQVRCHIEHLHALTSRFEAYLPRLYCFIPDISHLVNAHSSETLSCSMCHAAQDVLLALCGAR